MAFKDKKHGYEYIGQYHKNHYDKFGVTLPKGTHARIKAAAEAQGLSVSKFIFKCVEPARECEIISVNSDLL